MESHLSDMMADVIAIVADKWPLCEKADVVAIVADGIATQVGRLEARSYYLGGRRNSHWVTLF